MESKEAAARSRQLSFHDAQTDDGYEEWEENEGPQVDERYTQFIANGELFRALYEQYPQDVCRMISKAERNMLGLTCAALPYAELDYELFGELMLRILGSHSYGKIFLDIGSGTGKLVLAAYLLNTFSKCIGIEILESLSFVSAEVVEEFTKRYYDSDEPLTMNFINGDATVVDWSYVDVAFAYASGFSADTMAKLAHIAQEMKHGSLFICLTHR